MNNMTSIDEIVKYQQELLSHQENQKNLQKETIKLLNELNKNLNFMSERLDEFAFKTNIKFDESLTHSQHLNSTTTNSNSNNNSASIVTSILNQVWSYNESLLRQTTSDIISKLFARFYSTRIVPKKRKHSSILFCNF